MRPPPSDFAVAGGAGCPGGTSGSFSISAMTDSMRAFCSGVSPPLHWSISATPLRAIAPGMAVIATFWTRPPRTCGATGSALSDSTSTVGRVPPRPNDSGVEPKPFGTISATGTSPARTAASAAARVYAGAPGFSCGARRTSRPCSAASAAVRRRDSDDPSSSTSATGILRVAPRPPAKTPAKTEKKATGRTNDRIIAARSWRRLRNRFFATARIDFIRAAPVPSSGGRPARASGSSRSGRARRRRARGRSRAAAGSPRRGWSP